MCKSLQAVQGALVSLKNSKDSPEDGHGLKFNTVRRYDLQTLIFATIRPYKRCVRVSVASLRPVMGCRELPEAVRVSRFSDQRGSEDFTNPTSSTL